MRLTDNDGIIVLCNDSFASLFDKTKDELINRPISDLYIEDSKNNVISKYKQNFIQGMVKDYIESSAVLWNGKKLFFEISNSIIQDFDGKRFLLSIFSCLLYTSPSPRDRTRSRMPSSACKKNTHTQTHTHNNTHTHTTNYSTNENT